MQKCMYCGVEMDDSCVLTVCHTCGVKVWGEKMFNTIVNNMDEANSRGDLCHASNSCGISVNPEEEKERVNSFEF